MGLENPGIPISCSWPVTLTCQVLEALLGVSTAKWSLAAPLPQMQGSCVPGLRCGRHSLGHFRGAAVMGRAEAERQVRWGSRHHKVAPRTEVRRQFSVSSRGLMASQRCSAVSSLFRCRPQHFRWLLLMHTDVFIFRNCVYSWDETCHRQLYNHHGCWPLTPCEWYVSLLAIYYSLSLFYWPTVYS